MYIQQQHISKYAKEGKEWKDKGKKSPYSDRLMVIVSNCAHCQESLWLSDEMLIF